MIFNQNQKWHFFGQKASPRASFVGISFGREDIVASEGSLRPLTTSILPTKMTFQIRKAKARLEIPARPHQGGLPLFANETVNHQQNSMLIKDKRAWTTKLRTYAWCMPTSHLFRLWCQSLNKDTLKTTGFGSQNGQCIGDLKNSDAIRRRWCTEFNHDRSFSIT